MKYLGIDPASKVNLGFALIEDNNLILSFTAILSGEPAGKRLYDARTELELILLKYKPTYIVLEQSTGFGLSFVRSNLNEFCGVFKLLAFQFETEVIELSPKHVKKVFVGSGNAKKTQMIKKARELFNLEKISEHEADAIALAYVAQLEQKKKVDTQGLEP